MAKLFLSPYVCYLDEIVAKLFLLPYVSCPAETVAKLFLLPYVSCLAETVAKLLLFPYISCLAKTVAKLFLLPYVSCLAKTVSKLFLFHYGAVAKFVLLPYVSCLVLYKPTLRIILGLLFDLGSSGLEPLTLAILAYWAYYTIFSLSVFLSIFFKQIKFQTVDRHTAGQKYKCRLVDTNG